MSASSNRQSSYGAGGAAAGAARQRAQSAATLSSGSRRAPSRSAPMVDREEAYSYALRVAYLNYLLQPKNKRRTYMPAPKVVAPTRTHSSIGQLVAELAPGNSSSLKLPHDFRKPLEKRMEGVLRGSEKLPGFTDPAVKRCFAEAYTAFTERSFQKAIDKERKLESLVLIFYSSAVKVAQKGAVDDSWKTLPDRHSALFVRFITSILRDMGQERERAELMSRLTGLEKKLLAHEDLADDSAGATTVEVIVPLSHLVKDMPLVQTVATIFGATPAQAQADINANRAAWTEEAALRDLVAYQQRLASGQHGTLKATDFGSDEAWQVWKKAESKYVTDMILDVFAAKPELRKSPHHSGLDVAGPGSTRPRSVMFAGSGGGGGDDYASLSRATSYDDAADPSAAAAAALGLDSLSLDQSSTIRSVDEPTYTFVPHAPRQYYRAVLQVAFAYDQSNSDPELDTSDLPFTPLSQDSHDLMVEMAVRWRVPQSSRLVTLTDVVARKFNEGEMDGEKLDQALEHIKTPAEPRRKDPPILHYPESLLSLDPTFWLSEDVDAYQKVLSGLHHSLLRDLHNLLMRCYEATAPSIGVAMHNITTHILADPLFVDNPEDEAWFSEELTSGLRRHADEVYRSYIDQHLPAQPEDWNFLHIVELGKAVTKLCEKIRKRYAKNPKILGVSPLAVLVENMLPSFEEDVNAIVQRILVQATESGAPVHVQDGFDLYKELCQIRVIHQKFLPGKPFGFAVEDLLVDFVWRFIQEAEQTLSARIDEAIKLDPFEVRIHAEGQAPADEERHSSSIVDIFTLFNATVSQVIALKWENEVHHAKFMTALSKSFSNGIGRYCEVVEGRFSKEMDRPTAQEAAAAATQRSAQERFLQYAKDAWATKEKPEPFQFYPTSLVKLNNIEYALHQMDKLEAAMNIDACIATLAKFEPPPPKAQGRKPNNYVFTVKIVEAEDLRACDPTGTSDPYVILGDEYRKRLYKSRIMYKTLNPKWDESVDVAARGPVNLVVTIWDFDMFGEHDCVGRTALKLDPAHFRDYLPQEFWLDLDTQGRVLLRVSMEGERDDIDFYFGKAFRHLKRAERDMVRRITEKLSAQINEALSRDTLRALLKSTGGGIGSSVTSLWKKTPAPAPSAGPGPADIEGALLPLCNYFNENFAIMNQTLARATMLAVMSRLWKEVLMTIESLVVPPLSEKPSSQKPLGQRELDIVFAWLAMLFEFFNAKDQSGEQLGVPINELKSQKYLELVSLNFFYFDDTASLIHESERIAATAAQRAQQNLRQTSLANHRISAPPMLSPLSAGTPFASMGTIRRGKSVSLARNLGTMRRVKEQKRKEAQAEPTDDMILRILRMRPEAAAFLKERHRQKERQAATAAAAMIVQNSVSQGWSSNLANVGPYNRNSLVPRR